MHKTGNLHLYYYYLLIKSVSQTTFDIRECCFLDALLMNIFHILTKSQHCLVIRKCFFSISFQLVLLSRSIPSWAHYKDFVFVLFNTSLLTSSFFYICFDGFMGSDFTGLKDISLMPVDK